MNHQTKEKPPFWFPVAPILVIVFIYLDLLFSKEIIIWLNLKTYLGTPQIIRFIIGGFLTIIGIVFFFWGFIKLKPAAAIGYAKKLRDTGAYGLTRNPMYFGLNSSLWGIGLILDNLSVLIAAFIWSVLIYLSVTLWEEKQMFRKFGNKYIEYKKRVPRFIPIKIKKIKK